MQRITTAKTLNHKVKKCSEYVKKEYLQKLKWKTTIAWGWNGEPMVLSQLMQNIMKTLFCDFFFSVLILSPKQFVNDQLNRKSAGNKYNQSFSVATTKTYLLLWEVKSLAPAVVLWNPSPIQTGDHTKHLSQKPANELAEQNPPMALSNLS